MPESTSGRRTSLWMLPAGVVLGLYLNLIAVTGALGGQNEEARVHLTEIPVLSIHRKEVVLDPGDRLVVTCKGSTALKWTYPVLEAQEPPIIKRVSITGNNTDSAKYPYESQLEVRGLMYADTGYFRCSYVSDIRNGPSATLYVYVYDAAHLYAPPTPDYIRGMGRPYLGLIYQGRPYVLPCRPTHPKAKVTLMKGNKALVLGDDLTYNPKQGFQILFPNPTYGSMMECRFEFNGTQEELTVLLSYRASTVVPQPELEASHTNVLVGENMTFRCYVRVAPGTIVHIKWSYSSKEHSDRIRISDTTKQSLVGNGYYYDEVQSKLTVRNVYPEDGGVYRCTVTTHDQKTNQRETLVNVHERTFVNLTPMSKTVEVKLGAASVSLSMSIYAYPPPWVLWYRNNRVIQPTDRHYETRVRSDRTKLKIYNPQRSDAGEYVLEAFSRDMNSSEKIILLVNEPPRVRVSPAVGSGYHLVGKRYNLTCTFTGFPLPSVLWWWQSCDQMGCEPQDARWRSVIKSRNIPMVERNEKQSTLTVLARESGFYRCGGSNKVGKHEQVIPFYATDVPNGFPSDPRILRPIEGSVMNMSCLANKLMFLMPRMYLLREGQPIVLMNRTNLTLSLSHTTYSHVLSLTLENVQLSDGGTYYCQTEDAQGARHRVDTHVYVRSMVAPTFTKHLDGTFYLEPGVRYNLECDAEGVPMPTIVWFKDGKPLELGPGKERQLNANHTRLMFNPISAEDTGVYSCEAANQAGSVGSNLTLNVQGAPPTVGKVSHGQLTQQHIGIIVGCSIVVLLLVGLALFLARRLHRPHYYPDECLLTSKGYINPDIPIDEQTDALAYDNKWEFPRERLTFGMLLGQGAFGKVVRAEAVGILGNPGTTTVAVKMPKDYSDADQMKSLLSELKVLIHIGQHLNIVNLLGACTRDMRKGVLYVIVEYCRYGNLREYLLKKRTNFVDTMEDIDCPQSTSNSVDMHRDVFLPDPEYVNTSRLEDHSVCDATDNNTSLTTKKLICFAFQIARGMDYLASRKYLHRDIAARNILLTDEGIVKIADFGLAKDCYKYDAYQKKTDGKVPVKWHALESLTHKIYTTKSDVWSYGVLLWELFTVGGNPYPSIEIDETFVDRLKNGYRLERPAYATEQIYGTMMQCWAADPNDRPDFAELGNRFGNLLQASVKQHYIALESQYLLVKDGTHSEYLRMAGGVMTYIPMSSDADNSAMESIPMDDDDVVADASDAGVSPDYSNTQYQRPPSSPSHVELQPMPSLDNDDVTPEEADIHDSPFDTTEKKDPQNECSVETKVMIHSQPKSEPDTSHGDSYYDFTTSQQVPFLQRSGSDRSENGGAPRGRKGYKCNDSVTSDTSSGFHSDYFPDEPVSPDHTQFVFPNTGVLKEVMV